MLTLQQVLQQGILALQSCSETPRTDAEVLLMHVLQKNHVYLIVHSNDELSTETQEDFMNLIESRRLGHPVAYLTRQKEFWSLMLQVGPETLIPRPETELLVERALHNIQYLKEPRILELGTGSGAIACALAHERPDAHILATDIHPATLDLAKHNARQHHLTNIQFTVSDWFESLPPSLKFDLILSNPPYLAEDEPHLTQGDLVFEPHRALCSGPLGTEAFETIFRFAGSYLKPQGWIMCEHGWLQKSKVQALMQHYGFQHIQTHQDIQQLDRVTEGQKIF